MMNLSISELNKIRSIYAQLLKKARVFIFLKNHPPPSLEYNQVINRIQSCIPRILPTNS